MTEYKRRTWADINRECAGMTSAERLEAARKDPNNVVLLPEQSGLRFPVILWGGYTAVGEAFGELAKERREREWRREWEARKNSLLTGGDDDTPSAG